MLLRDDTQAALNRVESACLETADGYDSAARQVEDPALRALFEQSARHCRELATDLAPHIRATGDLPRQPDPDREAVSHVMDGIKAFLSTNADTKLVEQRLAADTGLEDAVQDALQESLAPETRAMLERMLGEIRSLRERLLKQDI